MHTLIQISLHLQILTNPLSTLWQGSLNNFKIFLYLEAFSSKKGKAEASMRVDYMKVHSADQCSVTVEIHPRLYFALSFASAKDISMTNQGDMVLFLNQNFYQLHKEKPLL